MKTKEYYEKVWTNFWKECLEKAKKELEEDEMDLGYLQDTATEIFEETANAEQIIGYYIYFHKDWALKDWLENTNELNFSKQDKEIDRELKRLYLRNQDVE